MNTNDYISAFETHCKGNFPREFGAKTGKKGFTRNLIANSSEGIYNLVRAFNFKDCYISAYFIANQDFTTQIQPSVEIDTLFIDLDSENLSHTIREAKKLVGWLLDHNIKPRIYFSGKKGFHVYIDFKPITLENPKETLKRVAVKIAEKLNLKTIDYNVIELRRLARLPLTIHGDSGYRCTPINPEKLLKLDSISLIHYVKRNHDPIEISESKSFAKLLKYEDFKISTNKALKSILRPRFQVKNGNGWKEKRIKLYAETLREYGRLSANPEIVKIHLGNPHVNPENVGSIEHLARVHFVMLLIEAGYSDEEIHEIFKLAEDYKPEKTQYFIDYNRNRLSNSSFHAPPSSKGRKKERRW